MWELQNHSWQESAKRLKEEKQPSSAERAAAAAERYHSKAVVFVDKLRIVFKKGQQVKYISHLDMLRTFIRALRRAEVPVKYSEGFNPHAQITFAMPLAVGVTSDCEVVDVALSEPVNMIDTVKRLSNALPGGLELVSADVVFNSMPEYQKARYLLKVQNNTAVDEELTVAVTEALRRSEIMVEKKSKRKVTSVNILEHIYKFDIREAEGDTFTIDLTVSAGNKFNLKPELVVSGLESVLENFNPVDIDIHRLEILT